MKITETTKLFLRALANALLLVHGSIYLISTIATVDPLAYFSAENYAQVGRGILTALAIIYSFVSVEAYKENKGGR